MKRILQIALGICLLVGGASAARADLIIRAKPVTIHIAGQAGPIDSFFDVFVELTPGPALPEAAGFQVAVDLDPSATGNVELLGPALLPSAPHDPLISTNFVPDFAGDMRATLSGIRR